MARENQNELFRSLDAQLFEEPYRFSFFQAVRLLMQMGNGRTVLGQDGLPEQEAVRFRTHVTLGFPPSEIQDLARRPIGQGPPVMTVAFFGLMGTTGVLPYHYTEYLLERLKAKDTVLRDFLDLFNHRLLSLFYRAWEKHQVAVQFERARSDRSQEDRFAGYLYALVGMGTPGLRGRMGAHDGLLLRYAGLLSQRPRSAAALQQWLCDAFAMPVCIRQLVGEWLEIEAEDQTRLGTPGVNNRLGISATAGTTVWDQQAGFSIQMGPMSYRMFESLLPSGRAFHRLISMTKLFVGRELSFTIRPTLVASEVPDCRLQQTNQYAPRLGWTTWLKTRPMQQDADQVVFSGYARMGATT